MLLRPICALVCLLAFHTVYAGAVAAQPGAQPVVPDYERPPAPPPPQTYAPVPVTAELRLQFTMEELEILDRGEISTGQYVIGGALGSYFGFGLGHMIQQRWSSKGWIFTMGQVGSGGVALYGLLSCVATGGSSGGREPRHTLFGEEGCPYNLMIAAGLAYAGFRLWEIVDLWAGPPEHNRRLRRLQRGQQPRRYGFSIVPTGREGGVASLSLDF